MCNAIYINGSVNLLSVVIIWPISGKDVPLDALGDISHIGMYRPKG